MKFKSWKILTLLQSLTPTLLWQNSSFWYLFQIGYYLLQQPSGFSCKQTSWPKPELESALDNHKTMTDPSCFVRYINRLLWRLMFLENNWNGVTFIKDDKKCDLFMQKAGLNGSLKDIWPFKSRFKVWNSDNFAFYMMHILTFDRSLTQFHCFCLHFAPSWDIVVV